jgi:hypothetical protein
MAVFVTAAITYAVQAQRASDRRLSSIWALHALAAAAMAVMLWPTGMAISPLLYLLFFTACGLFVAYAALTYGTVPHWRYHVAMMAAMAVMPMMMTALPAVTTMPTMAHHGSQMTMSAPPVMDSPIPEWLQASSAVLAGLLFLTALWWFYALLHSGHRQYSDLLMSIGMGTCFALCI